jgi:phenylacetic acid degradation operon negative regulatory protein
MTNAESAVTAVLGQPDRLASGPRACPSRERIEQFKAGARGQAGSMIVTVFGDVVLPRGGRIWLGSLIGLLAPLGLADRLVRTAVFRLAQDDWLEAVAHGRRSDYRLTGSGRRRFVEASRHIYAAEPAPWDQRWRLITVTGELESDQRERLRRALFWHGFGQLGADCFVHPSADLAGVFESLQSESLEPVLDRLLPLVAANPRLAASGKDADLVRRAWNLQGLDEAYRAFVDSYAPLLAQWRQAGAELDDEQAFLIRSLLIHDYRRLLLRDPELPGVLLPTRWAGHEARSLCRELYRRLLPASERHLDRHLSLADGQVPAATALLAERFSLADPLLAYA